MAPDEERIRRKHLGAEASLRSLGTLTIALGVLASYVTIKGLLQNQTFFVTPFSVDPWIFEYFTIAISLCLIGLGWWLRHLRIGAVIITALLYTPGLLLFPVGTIFSLLVLYCLLSPKGLFVTSPEYRKIMAVTPHLRPGTSIITYLLLLIVVLLFGFGAFSFFAFP